MISRPISLPPKESFFLLGPRQTGKSTLIHSILKPPLWEIDLLKTDLFLKYTKDPSLFRLEAEEKIKAGVRRIFIDEIQRIPDLLNEIQILMEKSSVQFILTGSSARKLKRGAANLLAGRALQRFLFPFTYEEIKNQFKLDSALLYGSLPPVWIKKTAEEKKDLLATYASIYLREEIQNEGIVRNLGGFSRFLDLAASQSGDILSFSAIARECQLPIKTVQSYYEVLEDTLIGFRLMVWKKSLRKRLTSHPKFYFFDTGVVNAINKNLTASLKGTFKGKLFEHFIILETYRFLQYHQSESNLYYWRTHHGAEVDLIIEKHGVILGAFEIKSSGVVSGADLSGLQAFREDYPDVPCEVISLSEHSFKIKEVRIRPWQQYLEELQRLI